MAGYGRDVWYEVADHTTLHRDLAADAAATYTQCQDRPALLKSIEACPECQRILGPAEAAPPPVAEPTRMHVPLDLAVLRALLFPALALDAAHRLAAVYAEGASVVGLVVECPRSPCPHDAVTVPGDPPPQDPRIR